MKVRVKFPLGRHVKRATGKNRHVALAVSALMTPVTLIMLVMSFWRIGSDINMASEFPITEGAWSHWQMWMAAASMSHIVTVLLNRYGRTGEMGIGKSIANGFTMLFGRGTAVRDRRDNRAIGD